MGDALRIWPRNSALLPGSRLGHCRNDAHSSRRSSSTLAAPTCVLPLDVTNPESIHRTLGAAGARMAEPAPFTRLQDVAEAVWRAAKDPSSPMRIPAGADAVALASSVN